MKIIRYLLLAVLTALPAFADTTGDQVLGSPVTFTVTVASGTQPFGYQWSRNGVAIPGATAAAYRIPAVAVTDAGTYTCAVSNKAGNAVSDKGIFTITVGPNGVTVTITYS